MAVFAVPLWEIQVQAFPCVSGVVQTPGVQMFIRGDAGKKKCTQIALSVCGILHTLHCVTLKIKHTILLQPPGCNKGLYSHSINLTETCCAAASAGFRGTMDFQAAQPELAPRDQLRDSLE